MGSHFIVGPYSTPGFTGFHYLSWSPNCPLTVHLFSLPCLSQFLPIVLLKARTPHLPLRCHFSSTKCVQMAAYIIPGNEEREIPGRQLFCCSALYLAQNPSKLRKSYSEKCHQLARLLPWTIGRRRLVPATRFSPIPVRPLPASMMPVNLQHCKR